ncbi:MAG: methylated-DNA--[protein]-cysteine S-methyltransferase [Ktedonobacterales bacterium]
MAKTITTAGLASGLVETWAGAVRIEASERGVRRVQLPEWIADTAPSAPAFGGVSILSSSSKDAECHVRQGLEEVAEYFVRARKVFTVSLDVPGPPFFSRVWAEVRRVPYGDTRSYREIAGMLGAAPATRAVGAANGANPVAPMVPCHRIVGSDGNLTGYGPGLALKQRLLVMEDAIPASSAEYPEWVERVTGRLGTPNWVLGLRRGHTYCAPLEAPVPLREMPNRIFPSESEAVLAGYQRLRAA